MSMKTPSVYVFLYIYLTTNPQIINLWNKWCQGVLKRGMSPSFCVNSRSQKTYLYCWEPKVMATFSLKLPLYWCTETVNKCLWPRMVRMETDCNMKNIGPLVFKLSLMTRKTIIHWTCFVLFSKLYYTSSFWSFKTIFETFFFYYCS